MKQAGISIALPDSWLVFDPTEAESRVAFDAAVEQVPALAQFSGAAADSEDHSVLQAIQMTDEGAPAVVFGLDSFPEQRVTEPVSLVRAQLRDAGVFDAVVVRAAKVAGRHAVKADCTLIVDEATSSGVEIVMYEFVGSHGGVVMVFAAPLGALPEQDIRAAVKSIRFLDRSQ